MCSPDAMEIIVHDTDTADSDSSSRSEAVIRFTLKNLIFNTNPVKGPIFYINGFPWCISVTRNSTNPDFVSVVLYCEYVSTNPWECRGFYRWRPLSHLEKTPSVEKAFKLTNITNEVRSQVYVPSSLINDIVIELQLKVTYHKCMWSNPELKGSLDDIGQLIANSVKIAANTEKLLQKQLNQNDRERKRIIELEEKTEELEEKVRYLEGCLEDHLKDTSSATTHATTYELSMHTARNGLSLDEQLADRIMNELKQKLISHFKIMLIEPLHETMLRLAAVERKRDNGC